MSGFPQTKYGICPWGGNTVENAAVTSGADATPNASQTTKSTLLKWYPRLGRYVCPQCIIRLDDDEKAIKAAFRHQKAQEWRTKVGFTNTIT